MSGQFAVDLSGSTVIVTGGTRGIGRVLATGFGRAGAKVAITSRHSEDCDAVAAELSEEGLDVAGFAAHMGDLEAICRLVDAVVDRFGALDIIINNAATGLAQEIGDLTPDAWDKSFQVNARGPVFLTERALPFLRNSEWPSLLNVISPGAFISAPEWSMYAAAKAALLSFTRSTAAALGPEGIRVNALCPGPVDTEIFRSNPNTVQRELAASTHLGRVAEPAEMLGPALFLTSRAASYITGEVLFATGGRRG